MNGDMGGAKAKEVLDSLRDVAMRAVWQRGLAKMVLVSCRGEAVKAKLNNTGSIEERKLVDQLDG